MESKQLVGFQLIGVRTEQFAIVDPHFNTNIPLNITVNFEIRKDDK